MSFITKPDLYVIKDVETGRYWAGWMRKFIVSPKMAIKIERDDWTLTELIRRGFQVELEEYHP